MCMLSLLLGGIIISPPNVKAADDKLSDYFVTNMESMLGNNQEANPNDVCIQIVRVFKTFYMIGESDGKLVLMYAVDTVDDFSRYAGYGIFDNPDYNEDDWDSETTITSTKYSTVSLSDVKNLYSLKKNDLLKVEAQDDTDLAFKTKEIDFNTASENLDKIHFFSETGEYIGSYGYDNIISSTNTTNSNLYEPAGTYDGKGVVKIESLKKSEDGTHYDVTISWDFSDRVKYHPYEPEVVDDISIMVFDSNGNYVSRSDSYYDYSEHELLFEGMPSNDYSDEYYDSDEPQLFDTTMPGNAWLIKNKCTFPLYWNGSYSFCLKSTMHEYIFDDKGFTDLPDSVMATPEPEDDPNAEGQTYPESTKTSSKNLKVTFDKLPKKVYTGTAVSVVMHTNYSAIKVFDSEKDPKYNKKSSFKVYKNGTYSYTATMKSGEEVKGKLKVTCFTDDIGDIDSNYFLDPNAPSAGDVTLPQTGSAPVGKLLLISGCVVLFGLAVIFRRKLFAVFKKGVH